MNTIDITTALDAAGDVDKQKHLIGRWLDKDRATAQAFWQHVLASGGLAIGDWKFVADPEQAKAILLDDKSFLVSEYNERMRATSGRFYLGMDADEHARDAQMGEIIPSWNRFDEPIAADLHALEDVRGTAAAVTRAVLAEVARRTEIAQLTYAQAECQFSLVELIAPVLDACAARFFGVPGHSAFSLIAWTKEVTWLHFRVHADKAVDLSTAEHASGQYRQHVLSLIAALERGETNPPLRKAVDKLRHLIGKNARDEDVARNLMGVLTGSITATAKAFIEAVRLQPLQAGSDRIAWPEVEPAHKPVASACPYAHGNLVQASFPHYDTLIATPLANARRGSLDVIYRKYKGDAERELGVTIHEHDLVIVWLGGTLDDTNQDNLFGIGVHKCPGMDMGKAILDGVMGVLSQFRGPDAPRRRDVEGEPALVFDKTSML